MRFLLSVLLLLPFAAPTHAADRLAVFDQAVRIVEEQFFDKGMNGVEWRAAVAEHRARIAPDINRAAFAAEVNTLLARLETSHTRLYTPDQPAWYQLAGVFLPGNAALAADLAPHLTDGVPAYAGIGVMVEERENGVFVTGVLQGHPAEAAGLLVGDRLVSVEDEPFHPIRSWKGRVGKKSSLTVQRTPNERLDLTVTPALLNGVTMFETAMSKSARVIERGGKRVGYIRAWSYAGQKYQDILTSKTISGPLKRADALVLDLRGGWGGASARYLNFFTENAVEMTSIGRDGKASSFASGWTKPVVLLVDEGARSGKELIAHGFRALSLGPIVGEATAGAVVGGRLNVLSDGSLLYVAVVNVLVDGVRLEGKGIEPDIAVPFNPVFTAGADPQLDRAVAEAARLASAEASTEEGPPPLR